LQAPNTASAFGSGHRFELAPELIKRDLGKVLVHPANLTALPKLEERS
jgi:uncharacterized phosphosugar-binding protein